MRVANLSATATARLIYPPGVVAPPFLEDRLQFPNLTGVSKYNYPMLMTDRVFQWINVGQAVADLLGLSDLPGPYPTFDQRRAQIATYLGVREC